jgi:hypothetical protein
LSRRRVRSLVQKSIPGKYGSPFGTMELRGETGVRVPV